MNADFSWRVAPAALELGTDSVHVWLLHDDALSAASSQHDVLADDERARIARYDAVRARAFSGVRASLRALLSRYSGFAASEIAFSYGTHGKPMFSRGGVHFSVSHAADRALIAFSRAAPLGIDLERVRADRRFDALTARFFSPLNASTIGAADVATLPQVFTEAWAQREAYVKAVGGGLYVTADALPFTPGRIPVHSVTALDGTAWDVLSIDAGDDFEAKLVLPAGAVSHLACFSDSA